VLIGVRRQAVADGLMSEKEVDGLLKRYEVDTRGRAVAFFSRGLPPFNLACHAFGLIWFQKNWIVWDFQPKYMVRNQMSPNA
jgi:hypothetical protein